MEIVLFLELQKNMKWESWPYGSFCNLHVENEEKMILTLVRSICTFFELLYERALFLLCSTVASGQVPNTKCTPLCFLLPDHTLL